MVATYVMSSLLHACKTTVCVVARGELKKIKIYIYIVARTRGHNNIMKLWCSSTAGVYIEEAINSRIIYFYTPGCVCTHVVHWSTISTLQLVQDKEMMPYRDMRNHRTYMYNNSAIITTEVWCFICTPWHSLS